MDIASFKEELAKYEAIANTFCKKEGHPNEYKSYVKLDHSIINEKVYEARIICTTCDKYTKIKSPTFYVSKEKVEGLEIRKLVPVATYLKAYEKYLQQKHFLY